MYQQWLGSGVNSNRHTAWYTNLASADDQVGASKAKSTAQRLLPDACWSLAHDTKGNRAGSVLPGKPDVWCQEADLYLFHWQHST